MAMGKTPFSAAASTVGYLFQCRYALLESLRRLRRDEQFMVSIETLDDVVFERDGEPPDLLQTKHHIKKTADLTDTSPDLWKTIRIWCEGLIKGNIPDGSTFFLITTAEAPKGASASYLKMGDTRDVSKALERLNATAQSSRNKANKYGYAAFRALSSDQKNKLFASVWIIGAAPFIQDLETMLREEVCFAVKRPFLESFIQRLEGWWLQRSIKHLTDPASEPTRSEELFAEVEGLSEQFKRENLPVDADIVDTVVDASGYQERVFVRQLHLIEIGNKRIFHAIRNYFRAFEQRSRWIREDLLFIGELDRYEDWLIEDWEVLFEAMREKLGQDAPENAKREAAQILYAWVESGALRPVRLDCREPFVARGTYHILADNQQVGWHPEFVERLRQLLEPQEALP
jgi:hypothetical protein